VLGSGKPLELRNARALHAQSLRLAIHHLREVLLVAGNGFGKRDTGVVTRLDDHALEQILDLDLVPTWMNIREPPVFHAFCETGTVLVELDRSLLECRESSDRRSSAWSATPARGAGRAPGRRVPGRSDFDQQP
jgi:hypothetical protein